MIAYLLQATFCWAIFFLIYIVFLKKETFFHINRWYLISTMLLGLLLPLIRLLSLEVLPVDEVTAVFVYPIAASIEMLDVVVRPDTTQFWNWTSILLLIYLIGVVVTTARLVYGLWDIYQLYRQSEKKQMGEIILVRTDGNHLPFSFFHYLFWSKEMTLSQDDQQQILQHEQAHIIGRHTWDVMLIELISIIAWCSPMIWFYRKAIRTIHEYLADAYVLTSAERATYGHLLLRQAQASVKMALANHFFQSQLKNRIHMMTKTKSQSWKSAKYLIGIPAIFSLLILFSFQSKTISFFADHPELVGKPMTHGIHQFIKNGYDETAIHAFLTKQLTTATTAIYVDSGERVTGEFDQTMRISDFNKAYRELLLIFPEKQAELDEIIHQVAQENGINAQIDPNTIIYSAENSQETHDPIYKEVDEMPCFAACGTIKNKKERKICSDKNLLEFIFSRLKYPEDARKNEIEGTVVASFVIKPDGSIKDLQIERSIYESCDAEVLRVLEEMPDWIPGVHKGEKVHVQFMLPIKFKLDGNAPIDKEKELHGKLTEGKKIHLNSKNIRLNSSNSKPAPLFVIDGKIFEGDKGAIKEISPDDIEKIEVLKGDTAIEKYGDKGINGVIEMTTKKTNKNLEQNGKSLRKIKIEGQDEEKEVWVENIQKSTDKKEIVYKKVDEMPRLPGCEDLATLAEKEECSQKKLLTHIYTSIKFPKEAFKNGTQGTAVINFVVDKEGYVTNANIARDVADGCGAEALRVIKALPQFIPGKQNGKAVAVSMNIPVKYKLDDTPKEKPQLTTPSSDQKIVLKLDEVKVFPNPSTGIVNLQFKAKAASLRLSITDISGKEVYQELNTAFDGIYNKEINLSKEVKGTYLISIQMDGKVYTESLILQ